MFKAIACASLVLAGTALVRPASAADVRVYIHEEMSDYAKFRKSYDSFAATRRKMGVVAQSVYQSVDNKNDVTITHDFKSMDKAKAFIGNPDLKAEMEKVSAGKPPQIWFTTPGGK